MTRSEWIERAQQYFAKARAAFDAGDESAGEMYERKGDACMSNADYGTEPDNDWPKEPK